MRLLSSSEPADPPEVEVPGRLGVCMRVFGEVAYFALQVIAAGCGHVWAAVERFVPAPRYAVIFPVIEDRQRRRDRDDLVPVLPLAKAGIQDAPFRGREPSKDMSRSSSRQLGSLHLPVCGDWVIDGPPSSGGGLWLPPGGAQSSGRCSPRLSSRSSFCWPPFSMNRWMRALTSGRAKASRNLALVAA
jgi:hypothetical protein